MFILTNKRLLMSRPGFGRDVQRLPSACFVFFPPFQGQEAWGWVAVASPSLLASDDQQGPFQPLDGFWSLL